MKLKLMFQIFKCLLDFIASFQASFFHISNLEYAI